jgi:flagellar hook-basal body complex protein FliE
MNTTAITAALGGVTGIATTPSAQTTPAGGSETGSFADALTRLIDTTENTASEANQAVSGMLDKSVDVHDAMIAMQHAEMSLQLTIQIKNKLVQAYNDIMRMPV